MNAFHLFIAVLALIASTLAAADEGATYRVPVRDPRLERYALFPVENLAVTRAPEGMRIRFDLPSDLVGAKPVTIELAETTPMVFRGPRAEAVCASNGGDLECNVRYVRHIAYGWSAWRHLVSKYFLKKEYFKRLRVAMQFAGDPIGVLVIPASALDH